MSEEEVIEQEETGEEEIEEDDSKTYTAREFRKLQLENIKRRKQVQETTKELNTLKESQAKNQAVIEKLKGVFSGEDEDPETALNARLSQMEKTSEQARRTLRRAALIEALSKAGASKIEDAAALVYYRGSLDSLDVNLDTGTVAGVAEIVEALKGDRPDLWEADGQARQQQRSGRQVNTQNATDEGGSYASIIASMTGEQRADALEMGKRHGYPEEYALKLAAHHLSKRTATPLPRPEPPKKGA